MAKSSKTFQTFATNKVQPGSQLNAVALEIEQKRAQVILVSENANHQDPAFNFCANSKKEVRRLLVIFLGLPLDLTAVQGWRAWAVADHPVLFSFRMAFVKADATDEDLAKKVKEVCSSWFVANPAQERCGLSIGQMVRMPKDEKAKDDPSHLTLLFGSMGRELIQIELVARRFKDAILGFKKRKEYLEAIDNLLAESDPRKEPQSIPAAIAHPDPGIRRVNDKIPKLLLLGETGVGKTLVARHIADHCGGGELKHISIPEFLNQENMLEYELFGYAAGAYTGGIQKGSHGRFLEQVGGVIFLDEIGEASPGIQTKLLTFLDHFNVSPRGWKGEPFYCPVLIVAATNQNLVERGIRPELINRFTDIVRIPPLRDRMQDLDLILDCLLQRDSMNPGPFVSEIGQEAIESLRQMTFEQGNFRELENLFREACKRAHVQNRPYLVEADFHKPTRNAT